jgi:transposase
MAAIFVGIDVSKAHVDVHVRPNGEDMRFARDQAGMDQLLAFVSPLTPTCIALEATGGYENIVTATLSTAGLPVVVVNPAQVRHFARALGKQAKTDLLDAAVIAHFVEATKPELRQLPDEQTKLLNDLMARRRQIMQMLVAEQQRAHILSGPHLQQSVARLIKALKRELASVDQDIDTTVRRSPIWRAREGLMKTAPGVGDQVARTMLAEVPELGTLTRRQAASLVGAAPITRESGKWRGKSFIGGGRAPARAALYMASVSAIRCNPPLRAFYQRLCAAGKPKKVALLAVARKLITILNAMLRDSKPWTPA